MLSAKNIVPPGFFGHVDDLEADPYDPDQARALLAQTSYGEGFRMTIHGPNDRYINDARTIEAIAEFWTQVGVTTEVDTMPRNISFSDLIRSGADGFPGFDGPKFSMSLTGWGTVAGEATHTVSGILETYNAATRGGNGNFGRYSNPSIDSRPVLARQTIDRDARLALPAFTLPLIMLSTVIRLTRAGLREVLTSDHIRFARANGVREGRVIGWHAMKNILIPIVTVLGMEFGSVIAFAVVTESIFSWPGVGKMLMDAIAVLDRPLIVAYPIFVVTMFIVLNLMVDILYSLLDPRVGREAR